MEFKGTKGVWSVSKRASFNVINEKGHSIASTGGRSSNMEDLTEELQANAKLIAAAPDLLEALQMFVEYCYGTEMQQTERFKKAEKAINKALK